MSDKDVILKVENVSKLYKLGTVGTGTFGGDVQRFWKTKILGQEDPFLKIGQTNDRTSKEKADFVWALQDINFEVKRGEVLGIIGKNGAGKSTLLKLLSRITSPTTGSIKSAGRMASLLEVGTGFHPELTGRENIYLNGAILGMSKKEIKSKFEEIVDFSGCELYIDTPTKRYSSGMTVRLGFAVAAFLDPEILVVDEVLAVGDAEFQKKAIGKMKEVSSQGGRTVLYVSHNMGSVRQLCNTGIVLENGKMTYASNINDSLGYYLSNHSKALVYEQENIKQIPICITRLELITNGRELIDINDSLELKLTYSINLADNKRSIAVRISKDQSIVCMNFVHFDGDYIINKEIGEYTIIMKDFPKRLLKAGTFSIDVYTGIIRTSPDQAIESKIVFDIDVLKEDNFSSVYSKDRPGLIGIDVNWHKI